jgi:sterol desaturase/sphingolipid hydroxylase (fatty acid hydroxylase superfamily)
VAYSLLTAVIFATVGFATHLAAQAGHLRFYDDISELGWGYWAASVVVLILLQDAYFYWTHRLMHHRRLFRIVHRVHHRSTNPSPWAAYSFAPLEAFVHAAFVPLSAAIMPLHASALFTFLAVMITMNVLGHLGIELYPRGFATGRVGRWLVTSTHHNLHHSGGAGGNYGFYFTFWDRLMKTQRDEYVATFSRITERRATLTHRPEPSVIAPP